MPDSKIVVEALARFERMRSERGYFETDWWSIRDLVRPVTISFNPIAGTFHHVKTEMMYDGTAPEALEELASALHSYLTNPAERWFEVQVEGVSEDDLDSESREWLDAVSEIIYAQYRRESANLNGALHEAYLDIGSFGTCCIYQEWDTDDRAITFSAKPLAQCYFMENHRGMVDTVGRMMTWTIRQCKQEFGGVLPPKMMEIANQDQYIELVHLVTPRGDMRGQFPTSMPFASLWICLKTKELIGEYGYQSFPYHVARWTKLAGEIYGRGPAKKCLSDIKMLNSMERTLLKAGQKQVDPPLVLRNEGFLLPIRTAPGSLIYKEDEESQITPLETKGNLPWGEEKAVQKRQFIEKCFYSDWIRMEKEKVEMTAYEVQDRRDEKLRLMAPVLGRLVTELHGPMIARSYELLNSHDRIPLAPVSLQRKRLSVGYLSPAARAQTGTRANQIARYIQDLIPMAQMDPGVMDAVDFDRAAQELAKARGTPRSIMRSPEDLANVRAAKQQQQAMASAAQIAEPASKAVKNLADAQAVGAPA